MDPRFQARGWTRQLNRRMLLLLMTVIFLLTGCGKKQTVTTEEPVDITAGFDKKKDYVQTTKDETKILRMPEDTAEVYITLKKGVDLSRTGVLGDWTRIRLNDTTLYVRTADVKETEVQWVTEQKQARNQHIVFIDPAKQIYADQEKEALFPNGDPEGEDSKAKMGRAAVGVSSGLFEYEVTLAVAKKLQHDLELKGYTVILSRTTDTVSLSNGERAALANRSEAEICIRLTAGGSSNADTAGIYSLIASATNPSTGDMYQDSFYLANMLVTDACLSTTADRLGIYQTDKIVFLNYAKMPAVTVQLGFLSNAEEDKKLAQGYYQEQLAEGLTEGIDAYFKYLDEKTETNSEGNSEGDSKANSEEMTEAVTEEKTEEIPAGEE